MRPNANMPARVVLLIAIGAAAVITGVVTVVIPFGMRLAAAIDAAVFD